MLDVLTSLPGDEPSAGQTVTSVTLRGRDEVPAHLLWKAITTRVGQSLDPERIAADVRRLLELEALENASVESSASPRGVALTFVVRERPVLGRVEYRGLAPLPVGRHLPLARGEVYDPSRVFRAADRLREHLQDSGYLRAAIDARQHAEADGSVSVCFRVSRGPRFRVASLGFPGAAAIAEPELAAVLHTHDGKVNVEGAPYRADLLEPDLLWLSALYYDRGYLDVKVGPPRVALDEARGRARVEVPVEEGPIFRVGTLRFAGKLDGSTAEHLRLLGIESGVIFDRSAMLRGLERLRERYRSRGRNVDVVPESALDSEHGIVNLTLRVEELH